MNPCERLDSLLSLFLEDEASPAEIRFVEDHAARCPRCRAQVESTRALLERLHRLPAASVSADFTERVLARVRGLAPADLDAPPVIVLRPTRPAWALPLAAAAAVALAFLGVSQLRTGPEPTSTAVATHSEAPLEGIASNIEAPGPESAATPALPPEVITLGKGQKGESLGMVRDAYVLEAYELREPAGGGAPVVTPVSSGEDSRVMVTF